MHQLQFRIALLTLVALAFSSCDGMFEGIYDEPVPEKQSEFGFKDITNVSATENTSAYSRGWLYVKTVDYTGWTYIDFESQTVGYAGVYDDYDGKWDIAIHRYEVKTNNGKTKRTAFSDFDNLLSQDYLEAGGYEADEWNEDRVAIDLSGILDYNVVFLPTYVSQVIDWVQVIYPPYPPTYKSHDKIFVIKLENGKRVAMRLENYVNNNGVKAYLTIEYVYPFPLEEK